MRYPFDSPEAEELNKKIFETIYYFALKVRLVHEAYSAPLLFYRPLVRLPKSTVLMRPTRGHLLVKEFFSKTCGMCSHLTCGTGMS